MLLAAAAILAGYVAIWIWLNIRADYPLEFRENVALLTSDLQVRGGNPYAVENRPAYLNLYGIGYYWATYPFTRLCGNSYLVLRLVSVLFVAGTCALLFWGMWGDGIGFAFSMTAALVLFNQLGQGLSIVARPDSVGAFLLLASLVIPYRWGFKTRSLVLCGVCSLLGFLTKSYFVLGLPVVCAYLFLFESRRKAIVLAAAGAIAAIVTVFVIDQIYECYFIDTFWVMSDAIERDWRHLRNVAGVFVRDNVGFVLLLGAGIGLQTARWFRSRGQGMTASASIDVGKAEQPLLRIKLAFPVFALICSSLVVVLALGLHPGNDVLYYHQLITPFLFWVAFRTLQWRADQNVIFGTAATLLLLANIVYQGSNAAPLPRDESKAWHELDTMIASHSQVFTSPHLSHLLWRHGRRVYDAGHTDYIAGVLALAGTTGPVGDEYVARCHALLGEIQDKIRSEEFDLILICRGWSPLIPADDLKEHYTSKGIIPAPMTFGYWMALFPLEIWVPAGKLRDGAIR